jgi:hypothetical protein
VGNITNNRIAFSHFGRHTHGKNDQVFSCVRAKHQGPHGVEYVGSPLALWALYDTVDTAAGAPNDLEHNKRPLLQQPLSVIFDFKRFFKDRINNKIKNHLIPYKLVISAVKNHYVYLLLYYYNDIL